MPYHSVLFFIMLSLLSIPCFAQASRCESLGEANRQVAAQALDTIHSYGCCTDTVSNCLTSMPECRTAAFLSNEICRLASKGKTVSEISELMAYRQKAMSSDSKVYNIEVRPEHIWGNPESKVILTVYLCGRCPYCSRHVPQLIRLLEQSPLKDKVAVNLRYFPIKAHENSTPAALAIEAAAQMGKAWTYLILSYDNFDAFSLNQIQVWRNEIGLDADAFNKYMKDPAIRSAVAASKKEGLVNGVTTTPTFFINGRRIEGKFDPDAILSMLDEATSGSL